MRIDPINFGDVQRTCADIRSLNPVKPIQTSLPPFSAVNINAFLLVIDGVEPGLGKQGAKKYADPIDSSKSVFASFAEVQLILGEMLEMTKR